MPDESQYLMVRRPGAEPERVDLDPASPCAVGRAQGNRIVLTDASVSRNHARFLFRDGAWHVEDAGSKNGTKVNGRRIEAATRLVPGDLVQLGNFQVIYAAPAGHGTARVADVEGPMTMRSLSVEEFETGVGTSAINVGITAERMGHFMRAVDRVGLELLAHRRLEDLFEFIVNLAADVLRADRTAILLRERGSDQLYAKAVKQAVGAPEGDIVVSRTIARAAIEQKQAILTSDAQSDTRFREQVSVIQQRIHSAMCAPLWHDGDVLGLLYVDNVAAPMPFEDSDLRLLTLIAHLAAVKIRETEQQEALEGQKRMQEELRRAATLQQTLLPVDPLVRGPISVAGRNIPSFDVGGDYFDYVVGEGGRLVVGLGDVAGKGMAAALLMTHLHATVRAQTETERPLREIMGRLNRSIHQNVHGLRFITLFLAEIDCDQRRVTYVNGGHNPPYVLRATGEIETLSTGGLLLGVFPEAEYEAASLTLGAGDLLLLYSDGVTEARSPAPAEEEFGEERLVEFLRSTPGLKPLDVVEALIRRVREFSGEGQLADDVTVTAIRCGS
ncbi:MAG TPA: SpoIIE family protein phosphatase [Candidatus Eisenbacteria bacterium]